MATITKRADSWQAKVRRRGFSAVSETFRTRAAAERWARQIEHGLDVGQHTPAKEARRLVLADALDKYETECTAKKKGAKPESYRLAYWRKSDLAARPLTKIAASDVARHRDARLAEGKAANTVRLDLALLSNVFTVARKEWGLVGLSNPVKDVTKPSTHGTARERRLHAGEEARLLWSCRGGPGWLAPVVVLAIESAMRRGEIATLRDGLVDGRIVRLPKTKNGDRRNVPLSPRAQVAIRRLRRARGGKLRAAYPSDITHEFGDACERAGIVGLHFHDLRHEATSRLFERGLGLQDVAAITGHKTWAMLRRYTHPRAEDLAEKLAEKKPARQERAGG